VGKTAFILRILGMTGLTEDELAEIRRINQMDNVAATHGRKSQRFYHGTKVELKPGDLIEPGYRSNFGTRKQAAYVYLTATLDAATWGAELAVGEEPGRIYVVEPTGPIDDDPNLTDKKFPGNPTRRLKRLGIEAIED
jgi:hypothetical protein